MKKVVIIGGGASGLMAAIAARRNGAEVAVCERLDRVGKKLLSTGNGRGNITNLEITSENYNPSAKVFVDTAFSVFDNRKTLEFFDGIGLVTKADLSGRVYPYTNQAASVLDVLRLECDRLNVRILTDFKAVGIKDRKVVSDDGQSVEFDSLIIACGGSAAPKMGTDGVGYTLAQMLGHSKTKLFPSLVQLVCNVPKGLKGIRSEAIISLYCGDEFITQEHGEILFTDYGISGIAAMQVSRLTEGRECRISLDLLCGVEYSMLVEMLERNSKTRTLENLLVGIINKRISHTIIKSITDIPLTEAANKLSKAELKKIAGLIKNLSYKVTGTKSWNEAQVTHGGIKLSEVSAKTMESKLKKGVYFCGEILDVDGECGGYNLQWAWTSGYIAGVCAAGGVLCDKD